jgi:hypothetical protein
MEYKVGQILYLSNEKSLKVIPVQIVEEVIRTTMAGKEKTYMVQFPDKNKTVADIQTINKDLYSDIQQLKLDMIANATNSIEKIIETSQELVSIAFNINSLENKEVVNKEESHVQVDTNSDIIMVDLGNGLKAKMNTEELKKVKI